MDRESQGRNRDGQSFVCSWCHPTFAGTCGQGLINYGICVRCLQSKLMALPCPAPRKNCERLST